MIRSTAGMAVSTLGTESATEATSWTGFVHGADPDLAV